MSRLTLFTLQLLVAVVAVLLWQVLTTVPIGGVKLLPPFFFSTPSDVAARIVKWFVEGTIWKHLWITLVESVLAFVIGSVAGVLIGFWFAQQPRVAAVFDPYVKMINALPRVVLAPIFALWLGLGIWSKVALGVTLVFFIVFFNVYQGVKEVSPTVLANARMLGMSERAADAPRVLAFGALLDVLLASYRGRLCRRRRRGRRISRLGGRAWLPHPAGRGRVRRGRRVRRHVRARRLRARHRLPGHAGRTAAPGLAAGCGRKRAPSDARRFAGRLFVARPSPYKKVRQQQLARRPGGPHEIDQSSCW